MYLRRLYQLIALLLFAATVSAADTNWCATNSFITSINENVAIQCTQPTFSMISGSVTDAQVPDNITVTLAATASALAANGANCSGNNFALGVDASGVGECAQPAFSNLSGSETCAQHPALTGDVTSSAGSCATTLAAGSASNLNSGTLPAGRMPALTGNVTSSAGSVATTIANSVITNAMFAAGAYVKGVFVATCSGTATASSTLYLFPIGQISAFTCTITSPTSGIPMPSAGTLRNLTFKAGTGGKAGDAVTILKNTSATGMPTCTYGTGTTCSDTSTQGSVAAGDLITVKIATGVSDTTANVHASFELWN